LADEVTAAGVELEDADGVDRRDGGQEEVGGDEPGRPLVDRARQSAQQRGQPAVQPEGVHDRVGLHAGRQTPALPAWVESVTGAADMGVVGGSVEEFRVGVDLLDVVVLFERFDEPVDGRNRLRILQWHGGQRQLGNLGHLALDAALL